MAIIPLGHQSMATHQGRFFYVRFLEAPSPFLHAFFKNFKTNGERNDIKPKPKKADSGFNTL